jgi:hypothetical protein
MKEKREERDYMYDMVKLICSVINPSAAKEIFSPENQVIVTNSNFEQDLRNIDPNFNMDTVKEFLGDDNG